MQCRAEQKRLDDKKAAQEASQEEKNAEWPLFISTL